MPTTTHHYNHPLTNYNRGRALYDLTQYLGADNFDILLSAICTIADASGNPPQDKDIPSLLTTLTLQLDLILGISGYPTRVLLEWLALPYADARPEIDDLIKFYHSTKPRTTIKDNL